LQDTRIPHLANALRVELGNTRPLWRLVTTGPEFIAELVSEQKLLPAEAKSRVTGLLLGEDGQTCLLLMLTPAGRDHPRQVIETVRKIARTSSDLSDDDLRLAGSVYKVSMIDQASERSLRLLAVPSCLAALLVSWLLLRSIRLTLIVLVCAAYCGGLSVALVYTFHTGLNAVLVVVPTLVFVLTISGAVHLVNYYRDAVGETGENGAAERALQVGWLPCTMAAVTTAVGLGSLVVSDLAPVRDFGLYASVSVLLSLVVLLVFFYSALKLWPERSGPDSEAKQPITWRSDKFAARVIRHANGYTIAGILLLVMAVIGLYRTTATVDLFRNFRPGHELVRNYQWIERTLGPQAAVEVVVRFSKQNAWRLMTRLDHLEKVQNAVGAMEGIGPCLSVLSFAPPIPDRAVQRGVYKNKINAQRHRLIKEGWLAEEDGDELWRIHVRVPELNHGTFSDVIARLGNTIRPLFSEEDRIKLTFTGAYPLIDAAQDELLHDLLKSFLLAFAVLCPVIMVLVRGFWAGLITMVPNVFPVIVVFGMMGWLGIPIEIGTMLTASVALGIAVDDTLHLMTWYRRSVEAGEQRPSAIKTSMRRCAIAMIQTTLVVGVGMLLLVPAPFVPASQFAMLLVILMFLALIGDLILLPALLVSPLGRLFFQ
ncbi:MAG: MMPL family transporter, partial [Planctomycetales bacterium]